MKSSSIEYRSWTIDIYKDYCDALFYIRFEECGKIFYNAIAEDPSDFITSLDEIMWEKIDSKKLFPSSPKSFNSLPIVIGDSASKHLIETIKKVG